MFVTCSPASIGPKMGSTYFLGCRRCRYNMPRLARCALSLFVATSSPSLSPFVRRSARPFAFAFAAPSRTTCRAATTMAPEAPEAETSNVSLPRWDLSRFGFDSPFSDGVDSHLSETRKLAETFKGKYEGKLVSKLSPCGLSPIKISAFLIPHDGTLSLSFSYYYSCPNTDRALPPIGHRGVRANCYPPHPGFILPSSFV